MSRFSMHAKSSRMAVAFFSYLEHCLSRDLQDAHIGAAASSLDSAIDSLNEHLAR